MSIEAMKRIKSLLQDTKMIDSHTVSAVVAECDMAILAKQPATGEPVAALVRHRRLRTPADCAFDKKDHYSDWSDWEPTTLSYALAVTDPSRDRGLLPLYEMLPLYDHPAPRVPEFSRIAKHKLDELQKQGFGVTGYAIQRGTQRGFITDGGFVGWWRSDEAPRVPDSIDPPAEDGTEYDYCSGQAACYAEGWNTCRAAMLAAKEPS